MMSNWQNGTCDSTMCYEPNNLTVHPVDFEDVGTAAFSIFDDFAIWVQKHSAKFLWTLTWFDATGAFDGATINAEYLESYLSEAAFEDDDDQVPILPNTIFPILHVFTRFSNKYMCVKFLTNL
jgi:hypothetical protein